MKSFIVLVALVAVALAAPQRKYNQQQYQNNAGVVLVKELPHDNIGLDGYKYSYELSDGQKRDEQAQVQQIRGARSDEDSAILRVQGSFSYVGDDGQTYTVQYVADENGFQPQGAHLPVVA